LCVAIDNLLGKNKELKNKELKNKEQKRCLIRGLLVAYLISVGLLTKNGLKDLSVKISNQMSNRSRLLQTEFMDMLFIITLFLLENNMCLCYS
jgi:hypothetical protein